MVAVGLCFFRYVTPFYNNFSKLSGPLPSTFEANFKFHVKVC